MGLLEYLLAGAEKDAAYQAYNYASANLENKQIFCRLAEIKSQHEPLASIIGKTKTTREQLYAAAFYAVVGRMPEPPHA